MPTVRTPFIMSAFGLSTALAGAEHVFLRFDRFGSRSDSLLRQCARTGPGSVDAAATNVASYPVERRRLPGRWSAWSKLGREAILVLLLVSVLPRLSLLLSALAFSLMATLSLLVTSCLSRFISVASLGFGFLGFPFDPLQSMRHSLDGLQIYWLSSTIPFL